MFSFLFLCNLFISNFFHFTFSVHYFFPVASVPNCYLTTRFIRHFINATDVDQLSQSAASISYNNIFVQTVRVTRTFNPLSSPLIVTSTFLHHNTLKDEEIILTLSGPVKDLFFINKCL